MNRSTTRSQYRGQMSPEDIEAKVARLRERLGLEDVTFTEGVGLDAGSVSLRFQVLGRRVERTCATQPTPAANSACLALWLEDRARNLERGIESFEEAFADCLVLAANDDNDAAKGAWRVNHYEGQRSIEECIEVFRSSLARLSVAERDVKVTWDTAANWARLRMRLPSGAIVDKTSRTQKSCEANLAALALWLQSRARNWERGIESLDLDRVFAGNLLPAPAKVA